MPFPINWHVRRLLNYCFVLSPFYKISLQKIDECQDDTMSTASLTDVSLTIRRVRFTTFECSTVWNWKQTFILQKGIWTNIKMYQFEPTLARFFSWYCILELHISSSKYTLIFKDVVWHRDCNLSILSNVIIKFHEHLHNKTNNFQLNLSTKKMMMLVFKAIFH